MKIILLGLLVVNFAKVGLEDGPALLDTLLCQTIECTVTAGKSIKIAFKNVFDEGQGEQRVQFKLKTSKDSDGKDIANCDIASYGTIHCSSKADGYSISINKEKVILLISKATSEHDGMFTLYTIPYKPHQQAESHNLEVLPDLPLKDKDLTVKMTTNIDNATGETISHVFSCGVFTQKPSEGGGYNVKWTDSNGNFFNSTKYYLGKFYLTLPTSERSATSLMTCHAVDKYNIEKTKTLTETDIEVSDLKAVNEFQNQEISSLKHDVKRLDLESKERNERIDYVIGWGVSGLTIVLIVMVVLWLQKYFSEHKKRKRQNVDQQFPPVNRNESNGNDFNLVLRDNEDTSFIPDPSDREIEERDCDAGPPS